jgi:hypothetical protein
MIKDVIANVLNGGLTATRFAYEKVGSYCVLTKMWRPLGCRSIVKWPGTCNIAEIAVNCSAVSGPRERVSICEITFAKNVSYGC